MGRIADILGTLGASFSIGPRSARAVLDASGLSAARTLAFPNKSGTFALTSDLGTPGYIDGLYLSYIDSGHIVISAGAAYVPEAGGIVKVAATTTLGPTGIVSVGKFVHVFLKGDGTFGLDAGVTAPYNGSARSDITTSQYRYIGSVLMTAIGSATPFLQLGTRVRYLATTNVSPFRILSGGTSTTAVTVSASGCIPVTAQRLDARTLNNATAAQVYFATPDMGMVSPSNYMATVQPGNDGYYELVTDTSQNINYIFNNSTASGGCYIDVMGYTYLR